MCPPHSIPPELQVTGETTYDQPREMLALGNGTGAGTQPEPSVESEWSKHFDSEFQVDYWYNEATGEASYEQPAGFGPET